MRIFNYLLFYISHISHINQQEKMVWYEAEGILNEEEYAFLRAYQPIEIITKYEKIISKESYEIYVRMLFIKTLDKFLGTKDECQVHWEIERIELNDSWCYCKKFKLNDLKKKLPPELFERLTESPAAVNFYHKLHGDGNRTFVCLEKQPITAATKLCDYLMIQNTPDDCYIWFPSLI